jgi:cobalt transporter subunit CbtB
MAAPLTVPRPGDHVQVPAWGFVLLVAAVFGSYVVLQENGWLVSSWETVHELFHDGRHALAFPCH